MSSAPSQYAFIAKQWPELHGEALRVERWALDDHRTAYFYARGTIELQVEWLYANDAVHRTKPISPAVSVLVADELFQVFRWLALTYGRDATSIRGFSFDKALLPQPQSSPREPAPSLEQLQELANQLAERDSSPAPCQCGHQPTRSGSHRT